MLAGGCLSYWDDKQNTAPGITNQKKTGMGPGMIPKQVVTDGPVVTKTNAPGPVWMEEHFLI